MGWPAADGNSGTGAGGAGFARSWSPADGRLYVFAVNIGENPQMFRLEVPGKWGGASVKEERRAVRLHDGQLSDTMAPFASHVYELVKH